MNIKGVATRVMAGLVIALALPVVAQTGSTWETDSERTVREMQEKAKKREEEERARIEAIAKASISTFTDSRDGQKYRTVKIGDKTFMAENLNYAIAGSGCYNDDVSMCEKYGRLYRFDAAKSVCQGMGGKWQLPTHEDWRRLMWIAGGERDVYHHAVIHRGASGKFKSKSGWDDNGNGTDDYGFSALPGGKRYDTGGFTDVGRRGYWWSSTYDQGRYIMYLIIEAQYDYTIEGSGGGDSFSVRCVADGSETSAQPSTPQTRSTPELKVSGSSDLSLTGGRSRDSIQRVVMQNMAATRYAYRRRLRDKPGLNGKITVKFAINEFGKVIFAQVVESTMADSELERTMVDRVKSWNFDKIDKPGDVTEVTYPFVFSQ